MQFESMATDGMPVDLMLSDESTFEKLFTHSVAAGGNEKMLRTVSLDHLVALKCHAVKLGHAGRIEKDADDLLGLAKANNLDWNEDRWREIIIKHGTKELYEKLQRS